MIWDKLKAEKWQKEQDEKNKQLEEEMVEKIKADKDFINSLSPEKQTEYKLFKIIFSTFMIVFYLAAYIGYKKGFIKYLLPIVIIETIIGITSFVLWRIKPKKIKYPSVFVMPFIAYGLTLLGIGGFFLSDAIEGNFSKPKNNEIVVEQEVNNSSDYESWLVENSFIEGEE